jgi:hypothetical protein
MSLLSNVIEIINNNLNTVFCSQIKRINGLVDVLIIEGKTFPIIKVLGKNQCAFFSDDYQIDAYHKLNLEQNNTDFSEGFGDKKLISKSMDLSFILYAKNFETEIVCSNLDIAFNTQLTSLQRRDLGLQFCEINLSNIVVDKQRIFEREFVELRYKLSDLDSLIEVNYRVDYKTLNDCYKINIC